MTCLRSRAVAKPSEQRSVAGKTANIIFFMFLAGVEDNRTAGSLSVGVDP